MKFFDFIYTNILFSKKGDNSIDALVVVTLCQTFNILSIINLFLFFSKITNDYDIPTIFILILILVTIYNFAVKKFVLLHFTSYICHNKNKMLCLIKK